MIYYFQSCSSVIMSHSTFGKSLYIFTCFIQAALRAKAAGSTRFCMGAAWRGPSQVGPRQWQRVLDMVTQIRQLGMEVCTTLGMLTPEQAQELRTAGLTAYNHNLDTSPEFYPKVTTSRKYKVGRTQLWPA